MSMRTATLAVTVLWAAAFVFPDMVPFAVQVVSSTEKERTGIGTNKDVMATLSCWGYGYKVKMLVNGIDIGIAGGKSETRRLFSTDHAMAASVPPDIRRKQFVLKDGANQIVIEFTKLTKSESDRLEISLLMEDYPAPLFLLHSRWKPSGKIEKTISIQETVPEDFRPVFVSDEGEERSAFIYVSSMNVTVTPIVNGQEGMTLAGMPHSIVLEGTKPGENTLAIRYKGEPNGELRLAIITPEWTKYFIWKIQDSSEKVETFTFNAK